MKLWKWVNIADFTSGWLGERDSKSHFDSRPCSKPFAPQYVDFSEQTAPIPFCTCRSWVYSCEVSCLLWTSKRQILPIKQHFATLYRNCLFARNYLIMSYSLGVHVNVIVFFIIISRIMGNKNYCYKSISMKGRSRFILLLALIL